MDRAEIAAELEWARTDFRGLLDAATTAELRAGTHGTKWSNEQLLFHMLFGYLLVHNLQPLVAVLTRLPHPSPRGLRRFSTPAPGRSMSSTLSAPSAVPGSSGTAAWSA